MYKCFKFRNNDGHLIWTTVINISYGRWELNIFVFFRTRIITSVGSDDVTANTRPDVSLRNNFFII